MQRDEIPCSALRPGQTKAGEPTVFVDPESYRTVRFAARDIYQLLPSVLISRAL
jgi:hypothetical protein